MTNTITDTAATENIKNYLDAPIQDLTPVQEFYNQANVFITGGTGFLGQILVEKLLHSCPDMSTVYLLIRNKKGKNSNTRLDEIFDNVIFSRLKKECPKFRHRVVGIGGDCALPGLDLSESDRCTLIEKVNIIFHVAATVRFDEHLKTAVAVNVRATQDILALARQMPNLKAVMHVSTAFSNCPLDVIEEKFYPPAADYKKLMTTESLSEKVLDEMTPMLLGKYPNTYAYTKQIAEDVVKQGSRDLPVGVLRPTIVVSTYKEPIKAWINNMYGPTGVTAGAAIGFMRALHCNPACNANIVPVDMCVNSLIAASWEVGTKFKQAIAERGTFEVPIYHYESSNDQPINWKSFIENCQYYGVKCPSVKAVWYYNLKLIKHYIMYCVAAFFLHIIPALIVDGGLLCIGKSPRLLKVYSKIHKFSAVISYFCTQQWTFESNNVRKLWYKMSERDKTIFFSDLKQLNWDEFFQLYAYGIRLYLLQDPLETMPEAQKKWNRLYWVHQTVKAVFGFLLLRMLWSLFSYVYAYV